MTTIKGVTMIELSKEFSKVLHKWLTPSQMALCLKRNRAEPSDAICHSHDFCDANMAMDQAGKTLGLDLSSHVCAEIQSKSGAYTDLWNEAWSLAKYAEFNADKVEAVYKDVMENGY